MAERFEADTEAPPGAYRCTACGEEIKLEARRELPPCLTCFNGWWELAEEDDA
jgi:hypothetical protein